MSNTFQVNSAYIKLDDDMPVIGRWFFAALSFFVLCILMRFLTHKDATAVLSLSSSVVLAPIFLWFTFLAGWRKKVTINKQKNTINIESGFIREMFTRTHYLQNFNKLEVITELTPSIGFGGAPRTRRPDKITKKFYFVGKEKLLIAKRCYAANDRVQDGAIKKLEYEFKDIFKSNCRRQ